ncbi:MAG: two-component system OmpR family response regulator [Rhodothermales bacterium]|jgi:two-component system OmpR family response regulator
MRLLIVEDEPDIASFVTKGLEEAGFAVTHCADGESACTLGLTGGFDAVVLDLMLPKLDGLSVLRRWREADLKTPVLILSARSELDERVEGLELGADDYLTKPFHLEELIARLRAIARRALGTESILQVGALKVNLMAREVTHGEKKLDLTVREFALLTFLMEVKGRVVTRMQIYERVWGYHFDPGTNLADVYIKRVRQKLADAGAANVIDTVRGVGYRVPVELKP